MPTPVLDIAYPVLAIRVDGRTIVLDTRTKLEAATRRFRSDGGYASYFDAAPNDDTWGRHAAGLGLQCAAWILRDLYGRVVSPRDINGMTNWPRRYVSSRLRIQLDAEERGLAIPFTGKRRHRRWFRRVGTMCELRAQDMSAYREDDSGVPIKGDNRLRSRHIPNSWDDIYRHREKNWKRQRTTRWHRVVPA